MKIFKTTLCLLFLATNIGANPFKRFVKDSYSAFKLSSLLWTSVATGTGTVISVVETTDTAIKSYKQGQFSDNDKKNIKKGTLLTVGLGAAYLVSSVILIKKF